MVIKVKDTKYAQCPYCYDGVVSYDIINNVYYCTDCDKQVKLK